MTWLECCVFFLFHCIAEASHVEQQDSGFSEDLWTYFSDRDDISFADDVVVVNRDGDAVPPNEASHIILDDYEYMKGSADIKSAWSAHKSGDLKSVNGMYKVPHRIPDGPDFLFLHRGKAYACRVPIDGKVADAVSDSVFEMYSPDRPRLRSLYIQGIPILDHLLEDARDSGFSDSFPESITDSAESFDFSESFDSSQFSDFSKPPDSSQFSDIAKSSDSGQFSHVAESFDSTESSDFTTPLDSAHRSDADPSLKRNAFNELFTRLRARSYGWIFLEDQIPIPIYKWHVSSTRISSFANQVTRAGFFADKLKIPWKHLVDKVRTSRQNVVIDTDGGSRATLDNASTRFWDRIAAKAFRHASASAYWTHLVHSFSPGRDSLRLVKHSSYYSNLLPGAQVPFAGGMVFVKTGPRVNYEGKVTLTLARNPDGSFTVNYSFLREWGIKAVLIGALGVPHVKGLEYGWAGVVIRPYKNQREWNFARAGMSAHDAAEVLERFARNTLTDVTTFTGDWTGQWTILDSADVSIGAGLGYNLLGGAPVMAMADSLEGRASVAFASDLNVQGSANIARQRHVDTATHATTTTWELSATAHPAHSVQTLWNIEPPEHRATQGDGTIPQIRGDTEDGGERGLPSKYYARNGRNRLVDLVTKKKLWHTPESALQTLVRRCMCSEVDQSDT